MIVVADASPIICLGRIGHLQLLRDLFGSVMVPTVVRDEIAAGAGGDSLLSEAPWIEVRPVANGARVRELEASVDPGEAAAIVLALECRADALLIDERAGRALATREGLTVIGVVGVAIKAKEAALVASVRTLLEDLVLKADFWLSPAVIESALRLAGEED